MKNRKKSSLVPWAVDSRSLIRWVQKGLPVRYKGKTMYLCSMIPQKNNGKKCRNDNVMMVDYTRTPDDIGVVTHMDNIDLLI